MDTKKALGMVFFVVFTFFFAPPASAQIRSIELQFSDGHFCVHCSIGVGKAATERLEKLGWGTKPVFKEDYKKATETVSPGPDLLNLRLLNIAEAMASYVFDSELTLVTVRAAGLVRAGKLIVSGPDILLQASDLSKYEGHSVTLTGFWKPPTRDEIKQAEKKKTRVLTKEALSVTQISLVR